MRKYLIALSSLFALVASANATTITFQQGINGYAGARDTELRFTEPDLNSGNEPNVSIDYDDGPGDVNPTHGLLGFDGIIGAGQIPANATINSATLTLTINSVGSGWTFHRMLTIWDENAVTWNSFGTGIQADGIEAAVTPTWSDGTGDGNANVDESVYVASLTSDVQAWANGSTNNGWAILPFVGGTNGIDFSSSEEFVASARPLLTVDYTAVPEPTGLALLGAGALLAGYRRHRTA